MRPWLILLAAAVTAGGSYAVAITSAEEESKECVRLHTEGNKIVSKLVLGKTVEIPWGRRGEPGKKIWLELRTEEAK